MQNFNKNLRFVEALEKKKIGFSLLFPFSFIALLWLIKLIEWQFDLSFTQFGILPRNASGLLGILFSPLIHGSFNHLINNSIPLLILGTSLFYFYRPLAFKIVFWSYFLSGLYTWISARYSYHIGASGLVYALFGFIFLSGFIRRNIHLVAISFLVAFLYGSLVWGVLPWDKTISWEGHFWGLFIGIILAFYYRKIGPQEKKYIWELEEEEEVDESFVLPEEQETPIEERRIEYHFVPKEKKED